MRHPVVLRVLALLLCSGLPLPLRTQVAASPLGPLRRVPVEFSRITGIRALSDGRIVVSDRKERRVVIVDAALRSATAVGREGTGPGEYVAPGELLALAADTTALVDLGAMRLTLFDGAGRAVGSQPLLIGLDVMAPTGAVAGAWIWHNPDHARAVRDLRIGVLRIDRATGRSDTVAVLRLPPQLAPERARIGWGPPAVALFARDTYAVAPDGWIAVVRYSPYRVDWVAPDGRLRRGPERSFELIPITAADKTAWADAFAQRRGSLTLSDGQRGEMRMPRPDVNRVHFPTHYPPFLDEAAIAAPTGEVWVRRAIPARLARAEYDVFDRSGALREVVTLAAGQRTLGFRGTEVLLATVDADGLEWLEIGGGPRR